MAAEEVEADKSDKVEQQVWRMAGLRGAARAAAAFVSECHRARNAKEVQLAFPTALNRVLMQIGTPLEQLRTSVTELHDDGRLVVPPGGFAASQRGRPPDMRLAPQPEQPGRFQQPGPRSGLAAYCAWANIHRGRGVAVVPDVERSLDIEFLLEHPADDVRPPWYEGTRVAEMYKPASGTWRGTTLSAPICVEEPSEGGPVERCLGTVNIAHQEAGRFGDDASYAWARACGEVIGGLYSARRARLLALKSWRGWHDSALPGLEALPAGEKERARVFANGPELLRLRGSTDKRVVAAKVGIDPKSLGGYERGNPALLSKLESLAQYYKVDVEKLIKS